MSCFLSRFLWEKAPRGTQAAAYVRGGSRIPDINWSNEQNRTGGSKKGRYIGRLELSDDKIEEMKHGYIIYITKLSTI